MKILKNKKVATAIVALLAVAISAAMTSSIANAHTPAWSIPTFAYVVAIPDPVGVNQRTTIYMFLGNLPYDQAALTNDYRYHNYKLTITAPDGTVTTQSWDYIGDPTNSQYYPFTPTQSGTYTLTFNYLGQNVNDYSHSPTSAYVNDTYQPSSYNATLIVQSNMFPTTVYTLPSQFPTEYWTRPIYGENTNWWSVSSNWLGAGVVGYGSLPGPNEQMFPGDAVGPQTGHIMWTKPLQFGGVVGGNNFAIQGNQYFEGSAYNQRFTNPIILSGVLYFTEPISFTAVSSFTGGKGGATDAVDLRTGRLLWSRDDVPALSFGLIWDHEDPNQHGVFPPILFTSSFARAFDAYTGDPMFNVTGVPGGSSVRGPNAEILKYVLTNLGTTSNPNYVLAEWNSTKLWNFVFNPYNPAASLLSPSIINSTGGALITNIPIPVSGTTGTLPNGTSIAVPFGSNIVVNGGVFNSSDPQNRYDWNVSIPWRNTITPAPSILSVFPGNMLLMRNGSYPALGAYNPYTYFAVNLNASKGPIGSVLWSNTVSPPSGRNITQMSYAGADPTVGVFAESYRETSQFVGYSMVTGQKMWGPTIPQNPLDYYGSQGPGTLASQIAYGRIYSSAYAGILYCYDMTTGNILWTYGNGVAGNSTNSGFTVPGPYPTFLNAIGNGVVYLVTSEHTVQTPIYPGALLRAVNATTGQEIFTLSNDNNDFGDISFAIADGFAATFNAYDNQIYSIGRGPSTTSLTASPKTSKIGDGVEIEGSVFDISAGTKQDEQAARFPNGVPVASDVTMKDWMGYVYQQKQPPTNATGVQVSLSVLDSNNNMYSIGNVTTDMTGAYHLFWQPPIPGEYVIYASFAGTNGYWPSSAETAVGVTQAPSASPIVTPTPTPTIVPTSPPVSPTATPTTVPPPTGGIGFEVYIAIAAVVIIVIVLVAALVLRRRK